MGAFNKHDAILQLTLAAKNGLLEIIKLLFAKYPELNVEHVRANNNEALRWAAARGHKDVLDFLFDKCPELGVEDVRANNNYALRVATVDGHVDVLVYLFDKCPELNVEDVRSCNNNGLRSASLYGRVDVLSFLFDRFGTEMTEQELTWCGKTKDDLHKQNNAWAICRAQSNLPIAWFDSMEDALACPLLANKKDLVVVQMERPNSDDCTSYSIRWNANDALLVDGIETFKDALAVWSKYPALHDRLYIKRDA
jgi:hypothetical protein